MKRKYVDMTPEERKRYKQHAEKIDREEGAEIRATVRAHFHIRSQLQGILDSLRTSREHQGITLTELADRLGMDKGNLSRILNEPDQNPTLDTLLRIADALDVDIDLTVRPRRAG